MVAASSGMVISHEGFEQAPDPKDLTAEVAQAEPAEEDAVDPETSGNTESSAKPAAKTSSSKKKTAGSSSSSSSGSELRRVPRTVRRVGGHLQKFFTGRNTIGR